MRKISNTEEANSYYKVVNDIINGYIKDYKIRPSEIKRYIQKNMESILKRNNLDDVIGIKTVFNDVLDHHHNMELDSVIKFENFIYENVDGVNIQHEKVLADFYKTSIGHVTLKNNASRLYLIEDFGKKITCAIYSDTELNNVRASIVDGMLESMADKKATINSKDNIINTIININDVLDSSKLKSVLLKSVDKNLVFKYIEQFLSKKWNCVVKHEGRLTDYNIWKLSKS